MSESVATPEAASGPARWAWKLNREEALAERAATGDDRAFEALFKRYHQPLYRYCRAILTDTQDAEDAVQATMVKALRALPGEKREIALRPWLYRVAHNESISILRTRHEAAELEPAELAAPSSMELTVEMRDRVRTLVADLATLPERQRASLVMRELNDLSYEDIGAALSTSPAAAKQSVYEARTALLAVAEGREMDCAKAREAISGGDRRVLRGRKVSAHLRGCDGCRDFEAAIADRRDTFAALAPPLAAPAAVALLQGVLGSSSAGGAGAGAAGTLGAGAAGGAAVKAAVAVVAVAALGGGAAATGVLDRDKGSGGDSAAPAAKTTPADDSTAPATTPPGTPAAQSEGQGNAGSAGAHGDKANGNGHGGGKNSQSGGAGNSENAPGHTGETPGQSVSAGAPGQSGTTPGQSGTSPGQSGATPAQGAPPPGQSATTPGQSGTSPGGGQATAPGQTGTAGNSATAPGQTTVDDATSSGNATGHATAPGQADK